MNRSASTLANKLEQGFDRGSKRGLLTGQRLKASDDGAVEPVQELADKDDRDETKGSQGSSEEATGGQLRCDTHK